MPFFVVAGPVKVNVVAVEVDGGDVAGHRTALFGLVQRPAAPHGGFLLVGLIFTTTVTVSTPPWPSSTVTVNVSVLAAGSAVAAAWRAAAVGV